MRHKKKKSKGENLQNFGVTQNYIHNVYQKRIFSLNKLVTVVLVSLFGLSLDNNNFLVYHSFPFPYNTYGISNKFSERNIGV